jgi:hypothetical protein
MSERPLPGALPLEKSHLTRKACARKQGPCGCLRPGIIWACPKGWCNSGLASGRAANRTSPESRADRSSTELPSDGNHVRRKACTRQSDSPIGLGALPLKAPGRRGYEASEGLLMATPSHPHDAAGHGHRVDFHMIGQRRGAAEQPVGGLPGVGDREIAGPIAMRERLDRSHGGDENGQNSRSKSGCDDFAAENGSQSRTAAPVRDWRRVTPLEAVGHAHLVER